MFGGGSFRVRVPRKTIPGSKPSTNVAVTATLLSTLARAPIHTSLTVANRVALQNEILPVNKLGRGALTTGATKVGAMLIPRGGHPSIRRVPTRVGGKLRVLFMRAVSSIVTRTFINKGKGG